MRYKEIMILELENALKETKSIRAYKRYSVLLNHFKGFNNREIASMVLVEEHTVGKYIKAYLSKGLAGLDIKKSTGAPRKLNPDQELKLVDVITNNTPDEVGFESRKNWTIELIRQWVINNFNILIKHSSMAVILKRLNLSYTRPTYVLENADPVKQKKFVEDFNGLKKTLDGLVDHILFEDESMIRDYQAIQKTWFIKGKQRKIPTYGKHCGVKLVGMLNYETGDVYCEEHEKYDAEVFLGFLKNVLLKYTTGKIVMILDNARIHHAKLIQPFLEENKDRLNLFFLPPYSPNLNLIEGLWGWLKSSVINNVFFHKTNEIRKAVNSFINVINTNPKEVVNRLCVKL
ncbi:MAG: IS630 family transposase [Bacilli bacterium]